MRPLILNLAGNEGAVWEWALKEERRLHGPRSVLLSLHTLLSLSLSVTAATAAADPGKTKQKGIEAKSLERGDSSWSDKIQASICLLRGDAR